MGCLAVYDTQEELKKEKFAKNERKNIDETYVRLKGMNAIEIHGISVRNK